MKSASILAAVALGAAVAAAQQNPPAPPATPAPATATPAAKTNLGADANGNPLRLALATGHVSNYDESKVKPYTLPDPLLSADKRPVKSAEAWRRERRRELVQAYETEIYGRIPANAPAVMWTAGPDGTSHEGAAVMRQISGRIGSATGPEIRVTIHTPANVTRRVPTILLVTFGGGPTPPRPGSSPDPPVAKEIIAKGWGYATVGYQDIQPDRANSFSEGVIGLTLSSGAQKPGPAEWGTISAWSWGISRILDYLETDRRVDAKQVAVFGHSRLGKTVLWASALDERIAAVFSSCAGEMGSALARRDWGETVDDMAQNFPWQFAGNFQKWSGRWNDMPVDAHMLIALSAPRPVFVTGGTTDQWADPVGEFLALVAAGPVYRLLGRKDLGVTTLPPLDTPLVDGDLGWHYHTGGHTATAADWTAFLTFVGKYFK